MNLEQLEAVVAVAEFGSFRSAAEKLNRSQPALSTAIKNLETEFQIRIFDRSEYRPKLTEAGASFLGFAKMTLESARQTARVGIELGRNKAETKLHVVVDPLISSDAIELIAEECARPVPAVNLIIQESLLKGSFEPLLRGRIDLALGPKPAHSPGIESIFLNSVTLVGAVSRRLLREKRRATPELLARHPQILAYDKSHNEPSDELLPHPVLHQHGQQIFVPSHFAKLRLIQAGVGWGRLSKEELEANPELVALEKSLFAHVSLDMCVLRAKAKPIGPTACAIWRAFQKRAEARES